jgi:hypothetical protein
MNKEAAEIFATALENDADEQDAGRYENIGMKWDDIYAQILPIEEDINTPIYNMAFRFWDDWCDASNHEWQYHEPITKNQWPQFARDLALSLRSGNIPTNQIIIDNFTPKPKIGVFQRLKQ